MPRNKADKPPAAKPATKVTQPAASDPTPSPPAPHVKDKAKPVPAKKKKGGKRPGRKEGASNYTPDQELALVNYAEVYEAMGKEAWVFVAEAMNDEFKTKRTGPSCMKRYRAIFAKAKQHKPTGDADMPELYAYHRKAKAALAQSRDGDGSVGDEGEEKENEGDGDGEEDEEEGEEDEEEGEEDKDGDGDGDEEEDEDEEESDMDWAEAVGGKGKAKADSPSMPGSDDEAKGDNAPGTSTAKPKPRPRPKPKPCRSISWDPQEASKAAKATPVEAKTPNTKSSSSLNNDAAKIGSSATKSPKVKASSSAKGQRVIPQAQGKVGTTSENPIHVLSQEPIVIDLVSARPSPTAVSTWLPPVSLSGSSSSSVVVLNNDNPPTTPANPTVDPTNLAGQKRKGEDQDAGTSCEKAAPEPKASGSNEQAIGGLFQAMNPQHMKDIADQGSITQLFMSQINTLQEDLRAERAARAALCRDLF
ncbi:hypothetical protein FRC08_008284 [Ceratobasidium sp. 394]|nr:hypothetical protein FRC08_008284 [Ceratobasidium sp. 394]